MGTTMKPPSTRLSIRSPEGRSTATGMVAGGASRASRVRNSARPTAVWGIVVCQTICARSLITHTACSWLAQSSPTKEDIRGAQLGLRTAVVEREKLGGTCLHVGCIPTKVLLHTAELLETMRAGAEMGIQASGVALDYGQVRRRMDRVVTTNFRGVEFLMRKNGIAVFAGDGRLLGPSRVRVAATDGSELILEGRHILVATGSRPRTLPGVVIDNHRVLDNAGTLPLPAVPRSLAILGAGAVGTEFASLFAAFGAAVTLIEMMPAILPLEDEDVSGVVAHELGRRGVAIRTGTAVTGVTASADGVRIAVRTGTAEDTIEAEY